MVKVIVQLKTPLFIAAFNRPECLSEVLQVVRRVSPTHLYIALDAPRKSVFGEDEKCREVRRLISAENFRGNVTLDAAAENMGCGKRLSSALAKFFDIYDRGIILEDDTVPSEDFFQFCEEALRVYGDDLEVGHICGSRFESPGPIGNSPARTIHPHIWGWATWAR